MYIFITIILLIPIYLEAGIILKEINDCDPNVKLPISLTLKAGENNFMHSATLNASVPIKDDDALFELEYAPVGNKYMRVATIKDHNFCGALKKLGGEFWYDIQRIFKAEVGKCPVKKGVYTATNFKFRPDLLAFKQIPKGNVQGRLIPVDKKTGQKLGCLFVKAVSF